VSYIYSILIIVYTLRKLISNLLIKILNIYNILA